MQEDVARSQGIQGAGSASAGAAAAADAEGGKAPPQRSLTDNEKRAKAFHKILKSMETLVRG